MVREAARSAGLEVAASLRGKHLNLSFTRPYRTGRVNYPALSAIAEGRLSEWCHAIELELSFNREELDMLHRRDYPLVGSLKGGPGVGQMHPSNLVSLTLK